MHPSIAKAREAIARAERSERDYADRLATRGIGDPDPLETWMALKNANAEAAPMLDQHDVSQSLSELRRFTARGLRSIDRELRQHVQERLVNIADMLGAEAGEMETRLRKQHAADIEKLRAEFAAQLNARRGPRYVTRGS